MQTRLSLRTGLKLSPSLIMTGQVLRLPADELEQLVQHEVVDNPALELVQTARPNEGIPIRYLTGASSNRSERYLPYAPEGVAAAPSALDQLEAQVNLIATGPDVEVARYLLYSLDRRGFLVAAPGEIAAELGVLDETVERGLRVLHELEPAGIGARDVCECLLLQCDRLAAERTDCEIARRVLAEAWDDFIHQRWERAARRVRLTIRDVAAAREFIARHLYPYPLPLLEPTSAGALARPDLVIREGGSAGQAGYQLEIPAAEDWELRISECFAAAVRCDASRGEPLSDAEQAWLRPHLERARLFMTAVSQRWATLRSIGQYLMEYQAQFLSGGARYLRPLTQAALARELCVHESTISRAVADKVLQLPSGRIVPLADLFDPSLAAKEVIRQLLADSMRALTDRELVDSLRAQGWTLARRTVAKYREQLNIPASYYRLCPAARE